MFYLGIILASIFGYLYGSVLWSVHISKWVRNINIYDFGSNNPGATNTLRALGKRWALVVALLDGFKVVITAFVAFGLSCIPSELFSQTSYFIPCVFAIIGHCWPIWFKFKGGKAVSCFCGLILVVSPSLFLCFFIIWWIVALSTGKVSLSSIIATFFILILMFFPWIYGTNNFVYQWNGYEGFKETWANGLWMFSFNNWLHTLTSNKEFADGIVTAQICILIGIVILAIRHIPNMKRLKNGTEQRIFPIKQKSVKENGFINKALIIVDYQYDFVDPNGKLYVKHAETKKEYILKLIKEFKDNSNLVIATKDNHPIDHYSFKQWGEHCLNGTKGCDLYIDENLMDKIIIKGTKKDAESYSAFYDEKGNSNFLDEFLKKNNIEELTIVGVALEVCVKATYEHALELGYKAFLDINGCQGFE
ncbi:glycerol-3-phosphate acyltransferase PlsY [Entomoplasma ellychniae]|uniref:Glycerol-3-phosphate acyltransferase n=1 Tax=Entomoplasma ellychniae TaxID=2114 RepID=A0A8E2QVP7_9MOLU|nr:glycerol-3-phosphate 1-O-acyltransferase PlsY [Entomoplasma ellychniae]PPE04551.1 glycerol-3-phosphate acyltransferase PlsY [Entomoplasma ellychniae]